MFLPNPADQPVILAALAAFFITLGILLPVVRVWWMTRTFPVVAHRATNPLTRAIQFGVGIGLVGVISWAILFSILGPGPLLVWPASRWMLAAGSALVLTGLLIVVVAQVQMGPSWRIGVDERPTELVSDGLFRVVRNPIYTGMLSMLLGLTLATPSPWTVCLMAYTTVLLAVQARLEETHLERAHGASFRSYASRVGRFLPGIGKLGRW